MIAADHLGREIRILWIKGSGLDMKTATPNQFAPLRLDELLSLYGREALADDDMVAFQFKCVLDPAAPKPSIETLLHAFIPASYVFHTHADAICALTDTSDRGAVIQRVYRNEVSLIPYIRPGFAPAKSVGEAVRNNPRLRALILDKHGLVTWGESAKAAYLETIWAVQAAEQAIRQPESRGRPDSAQLAPMGSDMRQRLAAVVMLALRRALGRYERGLLLYDDDPEVLSFLAHPLAQ
jgi:rhamnose utilization protein RhaD (predicted bifunctional aldolase and dehydrogenase)